jgi:hypothetical protein
MHPSSETVTSHRTIPMTRSDPSPVMSINTSTLSSADETGHDHLAALRLTKCSRSAEIRKQIPTGIA